jgi:hypothetical protein
VRTAGDALWTVFAFDKVEDSGTLSTPQVMSAVSAGHYYSQTPLPTPV